MRKPLLVAPIGCYFDKLTAVGTTLNCARRHDFLTFPSHCYCHTYLFITKSALRLTKMSVIWGEESLFVGRRVVVSLLAEPSGSFERLKLILFVWNYRKIIWNYSKMSETILSGSTLSESKWKCLKVTASRRAKCHNGWRTEVVFELLPGLPCHVMRHATFDDPCGEREHHHHATHKSSHPNDD
jgi:hypothetical protein